MLWKGFQKPKRLACNLDTLTDRYGEFYAQPFERGFGTTIGNALRGDHRGEDRGRAARVLFHPRSGRGRHRHYSESQADSSEDERRGPEDALPARRPAR